MEPAQMFKRPKPPSMGTKSERTKPSERAPKGSGQFGPGVKLNPANKKCEGETKFKFGNTQADIPADSEAAKALERVRNSIEKSDLISTDYGGDSSGLETEPHITLRYGIKGDDTAGIRAYLEKQAPFEATLRETAAFPPSESSDGGAPIIAPVEAPELHRIEAELDQHGDFIPRTFPEFKPHATLGYVKPDAAQKYVGLKETAGKTFTIDTISISKRDGSSEPVKLKGKANVESGNRGEPRAAATPSGEGSKEDASREPKTEGLLQAQPGEARSSGGGHEGVAGGERPKKPASESGRQTPATVEAEPLGKPVGGQEQEVTKPNKSPKVETYQERFKRAVQAKADKYLDTKVRRPNGDILTHRQIIDERMAQGGKTSVKMIQDDAAERKLDREIGAMRKTGVPTGNEMHPTTIRYRKLLAEQKAGIKVPSYRITVPDGTEWVVPKTEYDYAKSIEGKEASVPEPERHTFAGPGSDITIGSAQPETGGQRADIERTLRGYQEKGKPAIIEGDQLIIPDGRYQMAWDNGRLKISKIHDLSKVGWESVLGKSGIAQKDRWTSFNQAAKDELDARAKDKEQRDAAEREEAQAQREAEDKEKTRTAELQTRFTAEMRDKLKAAKFERVTFVPRGPKGAGFPIKGDGLGGLVAHKSIVDPGTYDISHAASGLIAGQNFRNAENAKIGVLRLQALADWTQDVEALKKDKDLFAKAAELVKTMKSSGATAMTPEDRAALEAKPAVAPRACGRG